MRVKRYCAINVLQHKDELGNIHKLRCKDFREIYKSESCAVKNLDKYTSVRAPL